MRYTFIPDDEAWERYTADLDRAEPHGHHGGPPDRYPAVVVSTWGETASGPFYDHQFLFKDDAVKFCKLFEVHYRKPLQSKWKPRGMKERKPRD